MVSKTYTHPLVNNHLCEIPPWTYTHGQKKFCYNNDQYRKIKVHSYILHTYYKHNYYIVSIHWRNLNIKSIKYFWMVGIYICTGGMSHGG